MIYFEMNQVSTDRYYSSLLLPLNFAVVEPPWPSLFLGQCFLVTYNVPDTYRLFLTGVPSNLWSRPVDVGTRQLQFSWSPSLFHPTISYTVEVTAEGQPEVVFTTNSTTVLFTPIELSCSLHYVRVKASNEIGQETVYGEGINASLISNHSSESLMVVVGRYDIMCCSLCACVCT